jgi:tryptophanyl-tRNA synthetase
MSEGERKKVLLSGIQPTGVFTLGNYIGAVRNWKQLQEDYECAYFIADLHSLTIRQEPADLRKHTKEAYALLLACGIDPEKSTIYIQSDVPETLELYLYLNMNCYLGELERVTTFKEKARKQPDNVNAGLLTYPTLMAADILQHRAAKVPVGKDQEQNMEMARKCARRFNNIYGDVFTIPEVYLGKAGARIMSLQDPEHKMSKSDENPNASIYLMDDKDTIMRKFKRAVTDLEAQVRYREEQPGIRNLIDIYSACTGKTPQEVEKEFDGKGYGDFKMAVGEAVIAQLAPMQEKYQEIIGEKSYLDGIMKENAEKAAYFANKTLRKVQKKIGFPERVR